MIQPLINLRYAVNRGEASLNQIVDIVATRMGYNRFARIGELMNQLVDAEYQLLNEVVIASEDARNTLQTVLIGGPIVAILFGVLLTVVIANSIDRRLGLVTSAATEMANGKIHEQYRLPDGQDEVGRLAQAFSQMAATIRQQLEEQRRVNEELRAANATKVAKEYLE
ncbi:HAMP domain-containing protein [uncultured Chloroflexus sp.]|uniref:HAMP domain-containing protein n=1 Tax=uncultured Chloroflexus sp. TaxID=214040 RepID=UPI0026104DCC|nr:HAMP domain-containing protein [uncultured Chloroflexus sp.]